MLMGFTIAAKSRRLHFVFAAMALIGLEFDILCNPFAPTVLIHMFMSSHVNSEANRAISSREAGQVELFEFRRFMQATWMLSKT